MRYIHGKNSNTQFIEWGEGADSQIRIDVDLSTDIAFREKLKERAEDDNEVISKYCDWFDTLDHDSDDDFTRGRAEFIYGLVGDGNAADRFGRLINLFMDFYVGDVRPWEEEPE